MAAKAPRDGMASFAHVIAAPGLYRRELLAGESVSIFSKFLEVKDKAVRFRHVMTRDIDGLVAAETTLTGVHIDTGTRRAIAFDELIRDKLEGLVAKQA